MQPSTQQGGQITTNPNSGGIGQNPSSSILGILVDVSGSMQSVFSGHSEGKMRSCVQTVDRLTRATKSFVEKGRADTSSVVFTTAFGTHPETGVVTCDLLGLLRGLAPQIQNLEQTQGYEPLLKLLASRGANNASRYVQTYLTPRQAQFLYLHFSKEQNSRALESIVRDLPSACKNLWNPLGWGVGFAQRHFVTTEKERDSAEYQWKKASEIAFSSIRQEGTSMIRNLPPSSTLYSSKEAIGILDELFAQHALSPYKHNSTSIDNAISATNEYQQSALLLPRVSDLIIQHTSPAALAVFAYANAVQRPNTSSSIMGYTSYMESMELMMAPYIFGYTPLYQALSEAKSKLSAHYDRKILLIFSDGVSNDKGDPVSLAQTLQNDVLIFSCFLSNDCGGNPKQLYCHEDNSWCDGAKKMFHMSSKVPTTHPSIVLARQKGWIIPTEGECRLFAQLNHPDAADEFAQLVETAIHNKRLVGELIVDYNLYVKINDKLSSAEAPTQKDGTCWANAVASVLHMACSRVVGRTVKSFDEIRQKLIDKYGACGQDTAAVLKAECPLYKLQVKEVDERGARDALNGRRPVVATYALHDDQWKNFSKFFAANKDGILTRSDVGDSKDGSAHVGHDVLLIEHGETFLRFMNNWGKDFASHGFFSIRDPAALDIPGRTLKFYDVFFTTADLSKDEIRAYEEEVMCRTSA